MLPASRTLFRRSSSPFWGLQKNSLKNALGFYGLGLQLPILNLKLHLPKAGTLEDPLFGTKDVKKLSTDVHNKLESTQHKATSLMKQRNL